MPAHTRPETPPGVLLVVVGRVGVLGGDPSRGPLAEMTVTGFIAVASSGASGTSAADTEVSGRSPSTAMAVRA